MRHHPIRFIVGSLLSVAAVWVAAGAPVYMGV